MGGNEKLRSEGLHWYNTDTLATVCQNGFFADLLWWAEKQGSV
jgi:hypothetical protein